MSFVPTITDRKYAHGKTVSEYTISVTVQLIHQQVLSLSKEEVLRLIESVEKPVKVQIRSVRMYYGEDGSDHVGGEDGQLLPEQHHVQHLFCDGHYNTIIPYLPSCRHRGISSPRTKLLAARCECMHEHFHPITMLNS
jgi:hypothetical protein